MNMKHTQNFLEFFKGKKRGGIGLYIIVRLSTRQTKKIYFIATTLDIIRST